jgi:hypothetical protein
MRISEITKIVDVLFHGTCQSSAEALVKYGWKPNQVSSGANQGQGRYLYLTNVEENALWFAQEKGCDTIIKIKNIPMDFLKVDPEDGNHDTVEEELNNEFNLPAYLVLTKALGPEHFEIIS